MKVAVVTVRILMGLLFVFASVTYLFKLWPPQELTGNMKLFSGGLEASGYLMYLLKVTELVCGIAFVSGRYITLATVLIAPIIVNIFCVHLFLDQTGLPVAIFLVLANLFLAYNYRKNYETLFAAK
ncbi:MAG: DoxX family membrane protein [Candidatus Latescibacteria bacterium]|nr:DoxX family membrane protein [Candidatus Latescibacterota bacterium]